MYLGGMLNCSTKVYKLCYIESTWVPPEIHSRVFEYQLVRIGNAKCSSWGSKPCNPKPQMQIGLHSGEIWALLPTGSEETEVLRVGSIPVAILLSCQDMKTIAS